MNNGRLRRERRRLEVELNLEHLPSMHNTLGLIPSSENKPVGRAQRLKKTSAIEKEMNYGVLN
jgi:hypothetical protein